jgi:hypothetical protein
MRRNVIYAAAAIAIVTAVAGLYLYHTQNSLVNIPNLTLGDVAAYAGPNYAAYEVGAQAKIYVPAEPQYLESSVSVFSLTNKTLNMTSYPNLITSSVFLMSSSSSASYAAASMLQSVYNVSPQLVGAVFSNETSVNYTYNGTTVKIYGVPYVAVFNNSALSTNASYDGPVYEYNTLFSYDHYVGSIVVNGYAPQVSQPLTIKLTEALIRKLYNAPA